MAWEAGRFRLLPLLAALAGALLLQIGANLANDYFDYRHGADTAERRGYPRVTQSGLASPQRVRRWMVAAFAAALLPGGYLVWIGSWPILAIGLAAMGAAVAYTGGPWPYGYHGLGDLFVFLFFGPVAVAGTYYVLTGAWSLSALWAGAGVGAMATAILVVNNLRDIETDARAGKRTLAVRLGRAGTRGEYVVMVALAAVVPPVGVTILDWPAGVLIALGGLVPVAGPLRHILGGAAGQEAAPRLDPALAATARALGLYGLLLGTGFVV